MKLIPQGWFRVVVRAETKSKLVSCATNTLPLLSLLFLPSPFNFPIPPSLYPLRTTPSSKRYTSLPLFPLFFLFMEHETLHDRIKRISFDRRSGRTNKSGAFRFVPFRGRLWAAAVGHCAIAPAKNRPALGRVLIYNEFKPTQITRISGISFPREEISLSVSSQPFEWPCVRGILFIVVFRLLLWLKQRMKIIQISGFYSFIFIQILR